MFMKKKCLRDCYIPIQKVARSTTIILFLLLFCLGSIFAQGRMISGVVVDKSGETIIGANILEKGTTNGTITDVNGRFSLQVSANAILQVSYIGFDSKEVSVGNSTTLNITLEEDVASLEEVIVVGYGVQRKISVTNAISSIGSDNLSDRNSTNVNQALQGKLPGLTIIDKGGMPGEESLTMRIRGITSLNSNNPLVLIDGVPGSLSQVNPVDIESISVLKDAASTAIYGSRAAAGVLLVTTKTPTEGKVSVTYNGYLGFARTNNNPEHMGAVDYMIHQDWAGINTYGEKIYGDEYIAQWPANHARDPETYPLPNVWQDYMFSVAPQHSHTIAINGGNNVLRNRLSFRYMDQDGVLPNFKFSITEFRSRNELKLSNKLSFSSNVNVRFNKRTSPTNENSQYNMWQNSQWGVPYYSDGSYGLSVDSYSPLINALERGLNINESNLLSGIFKGEYQIFDALKFTAQYSLQKTFSHRNSFTKTYDFRDKLWPSRRTYNVNNSMTDRRTETNEEGIDLQLIYNKRFNKHSLSGLLAYSQIHQTGDWLQGYRQNFYNNELQALSMGAADGTQVATGGVNGSGYPDSEWGLRSYFTRINYEYDNKYLLEFNLRYDGSSRFASGYQYGVFPSISAGWNISNERFWIPMQETINHLKIRGSWGSVGSQQVGLFSFMNTYDLSTYLFNSQLATGYRVSSLATEDISWETTTQLNFGIDAYLINSKFNVTFDYYNKRTNDILLNVPIPAIMGFSQSRRNSGVVENKGFELQIGARQPFGDFGVELGFNVSYNQNKILDLAGTNPQLSTQSNSDYRTVQMEGQPINTYYGYQTDGFLTQADINNGYAVWDASAGPGDLKYVDQNGDGQLTPEDFVLLGHEFPNWTFSSNWSVSWKNLKLDLFWQGIAGSQKPMTGAIMEHGIWGGFAHKEYLNYWTPDNPNAKYPRPTKLTMKNAQICDFWVLNGDYLRLKNIRLSYDIPKNLCTQLKVSGISVYVSATNLLTFSDLNRLNIDPEMEARGQESSFPQTTVTTIGLNINF